MGILKKQTMADIPPNAENPLSAALNRRNGAVMDMVAAALKHNEVCLAYQPIMQARPPHQTAFYEAFVRVLDATGRVIPAREFIGQIENAELGREMDCKALELGLRALKEHPELRLAINMSARSIGYSRWNQVLDRFLRKSPRLGERLLLEISETSVMTVPEIVVDFMDKLQDRGIAFSLDDFGSSSISVAHFRNFFFDAVKIDGQFVRGVHNNLDNQNVVRALIGLAHEFEMLVIAESVENVADAEFLVTVGVDCLQGYLFGAPTVRPPWLPPAASARAG